jgi:NADH:ubiquinone oxidoreductase subunit B-like Fe-S oxidoreductase
MDHRILWHRARDDEIYVLEPNPEKSGKIYSWSWAVIQGVQQFIPIDTVIPSLRPDSTSADDVLDIDVPPLTNPRPWLIP